MIHKAITDDASGFRLNFTCMLARGETVSNGALYRSISKVKCVAGCRGCANVSLMRRAYEALCGSDSADLSISCRSDSSMREGGTRGDASSSCAVGRRDAS